MRLQVGRAYWTRGRAEMVKIESMNREVERGFHYIGFLSALGEMAWRRSGRFQDGELSPFDLVEPVTPDSKWIKKKRAPAGEREGGQG